MTKSNSYMDRAMRSADPRFARILGKLGYQRSDMIAKAEAEKEEDELTELRAQYQDVVGKRAYHGWTAEEIRSRIAQAVDREEKDV